MEQARELMLYDRYAAAYALATGAALLTVTEQDGWPRWVFDDHDGKASRALGEWRSGAPMVNARRYAEAFRRIKRAVR